MNILKLLYYKEEIESNISSLKNTIKHQEEQLTEE